MIFEKTGICPKGVIFEDMVYDFEKSVIFEKKSVYTSEQIVIDKLTGYLYNIYISLLLLLKLRHSINYCVIIAKIRCHEQK